jgi:hypothetical protein
MDEADLPEGAVDTTTYPPYRLVWSLEAFDKKDDLRAHEIILCRFDIGALRRIYRRPPSDSMVAGDWPVTGRFRRRIESLTGQKLRLERFSYSIGARAINYNEVNPPHV